MKEIERLYDAYVASHRVTTDSRAITPGCLFFAFKGATFDGNAFAPQALEQGAALCVISDPQYKVDDRCIVVPDVLATLQELAREHRSHITFPVIGITGTNGKTTTKELVHAVLAKRYKTSATAGNFNNHLGVPLTLLAIPTEAQIAIVEMGANHPGEIEQLCGIADPDCGLITNVGRAHRGLKLQEGMTFAIEPWFAGTDRVGVADDGWTVVTMDGSRAAHSEHTVVIRDGGGEILTAV